MWKLLIKQGIKKRSLETCVKFPPEYQHKLQQLKFVTGKNFKKILMDLIDDEISRIRTENRESTKD